MYSQRTNELFHRLWSKAVGTPDYEKAEWKELEHHLLSPLREARDATPAPWLDWPTEPGLWAAWHLKEPKPIYVRAESFQGRILVDSFGSDEGLYENEGWLFQRLHCELPPPPAPAAAVPSPPPAP